MQTVISINDFVKNTTDVQKMIDYITGKIYKLVCCETTAVYYGATTQTLEVRMNNHGRTYKKFQVNGGTSHVFFDIVKYSSCKIVLVEYYPCERKEELNARAGWYIRNNPCINTRLPDRTLKEYYQENREHIIAQSKEYRLKNPELHSTKRKEYYQKNRDKILEHIVCVCGGKYTSTHQSEHHKTLHHKKYLSNCQH